MGQNMMTDNSLSTHIESRSIFYDNFNINKNFGTFFTGTTRQNKTITPKSISYHYNFKRYMKQFLPAFSLEESEKYDLLTNKNSKYLLYKFNNWTESLNAEKIKSRHSSKAKDEIYLIKIEEKDNQFLIEIIIGAAKKQFNL